MTTKHITTARVEAIAEHMESLGAYTQAEEVRRLVRQRDALLAAMGAAAAREYVSQYACSGCGAPDDRCCCDIVYPYRED
jgi:hypothetical protein